MKRLLVQKIMILVPKNGIMGESKALDRLNIALYLLFGSQTCIESLLSRSGVLMIPIVETREQIIYQGSFAVSLV